MFSEEDFGEGDEAEFMELYSIDDTLDSITRLENYHASDFSLQRLMLVREVEDTAKECGYKATIERLIPLLSTFVSDAEPAVRQQLVEKLYPLAQFVLANGGDQGYHELTNTFLPYAFELLVDKNVETGAAAITALTKLAVLLKAEHIEPQLLNVVMSLAKDERSEDYRVVAAQLFNELAPCFGPALCREKVVPEVVALSKDIAFMVRKTVAGNLAKIGKEVGPEYFGEHVLPAYLNLSKDDIWGVRKACAETISDMASVVPASSRSGVLFEVFERFADDVSRWVRVAAHQQLGPLIASCGKEEVTPALVRRFADMALQRGTSGDTDIAEYCAYSFPAVVQTIGGERWSELEAAFTTLTKDVQWKVRRMLSHSLHEVARIVGRENAERAPAQAFDLFLRDLDEVKVGVVTHAAEFLEVLGPEAREKFIPFLCQVPSGGDNWRVRQLVAGVLGQIARLVGPEKCRTEVVEAEKKLLEDSVIEVRLRANESAAILLARLGEGRGEHSGDFLQFIKELFTKRNYQDRLQYTAIARAVVKLEAAGASKFSEDFVEGLVVLSRDSVANVRIGVARAIAELMGIERWRNDSRVQAAVQLLTSDRDRDVVFNVSQQPQSQAS